MFIINVEFENTVSLIRGDRAARPVILHARPGMLHPADFSGRAAEVHGRGDPVGPEQQGEHPDRLAGPQDPVHHQEDEPEPGDRVGEHPSVGVPPSVGTQLAAVADPL